MNKEQWSEVLDTHPLTTNQLGAVMREFERLGFHSERDREYRLGWIEYLLGIDELASVHDLTMGEAGKLVGMLMSVDNIQKLASRA